MNIHSVKKSKRFARRLRIEQLESRQLMATDVILEWNSVMLDANAADHSGTPEQGGPILTSRAFAIVSAAMYDAYNSIEKVGSPFLVRIKSSGNANSDAAVAQAAHDTLSSLYPSQKPRFDAALTQTLARIPNGNAEDRGRSIGLRVAQEILSNRSNDGVVQMMVYNPLYQPKNLPGFHNVDPLHPNQGFYAAGAFLVRPFIVQNVEQFQARRLDDGTAAGRIAFMQSAEYKAAFEEVKSLGGNGTTTPTQRTAEQTNIGLFWGYDGRPGLGTPPRLYNQIAQTIAIQQNNSVADNARLFALMNLSQADAGLSAWSSKYDDDFWRPVLGVRGGESDGNPDTVGDPNWLPLGAPASNPRPGDSNFTPPFPAYVSGHATFGAAVFETLEKFYGRDNIPFTFISDELNGITVGDDGNVRPLVPMTFNSFSQAKYENGQSRIYLGIHWAFDRDDGFKTGDGTADYIYKNALVPRSSSNVALRHNSFDPVDVDDDGECTPLDVLTVINMINLGETSSPYFVDVDNDQALSPIDALILVNELNHLHQHNGAGEGEASEESQYMAPVVFGKEMTLGSTEIEAQDENIELLQASNVVQIPTMPLARASAQPEQATGVQASDAEVAYDTDACDSYFVQLDNEFA